jgi:hypothetical protein
MGQNVSCYQCKADVTNYKIVYENAEIDKMCKSHAAKWNNEHVKEELAGFTACCTFASEKLDSIAPIVGRVTCSMHGHEMRMQQYLCTDCYRKTDFASVPDEWDIESFYGANGYRQK